MKEEEVVMVVLKGKGRVAAARVDVCVWMCMCVCVCDETLESIPPHHLQQQQQLRLQHSRKCHARELVSYCIVRGWMVFCT